MTFFLWMLTTTLTLFGFGGILLLGEHNVERPGKHLLAWVAFTVGLVGNIYLVF